MRIALWIGGGLAVAALAFAGFVTAQPSELHLERSRVIAAEPRDIEPFVTDLNLWLTWNPWSAMDPDQKTTLSDPPKGEGAWYSWEGPKSGSGKLTIVRVQPSRKVMETLEFTAPLASKATVGFSFHPEGAGTKVTWSYDERDIGFAGRAVGLLMNMDEMLGADFDKGLAALAPLAEQSRAAREEERRLRMEQAGAAHAGAGITEGEAR